jgi:methionine salvage enolase-phosphatase E1
LLSDAPNELEAARNLGIGTVSPVLFGRLFQLEGTVERMARYME